MNAEERIIGFSLIVLFCAIAAFIISMIVCWLDAAKKRELKIKIEWKWADKWIGVYDEIKSKKIFQNIIYAHNRTKKFRPVWICIVPCLPIHIWWEVKK